MWFSIKRVRIKNHFPTNALSLTWTVAVDTGVIDPSTGHSAADVGDAGTNTELSDWEGFEEGSSVAKETITDSKQSSATGRQPISVQQKLTSSGKQDAEDLSTPLNGFAVLEESDDEGASGTLVVPPRLEIRVDNL